jgi:hypothetical protein
MMNRLLDMEEKVRLSAVSTLIVILPIPELVGLKYPIFRDYYYKITQFLNDHENVGFNYKNIKK